MRVLLKFLGASSLLEQCMVGDADWGQVWNSLQWKEDKRAVPTHLQDPSASQQKAELGGGGSVL